MVTRTPVSTNDTLNIFLWPENPRVGDSAIGAVTAVKYLDVYGNPHQTSTEQMSLASYNGEAVFYATNIRAKDLNTITSISVSSGSGSGFSNISRGVIQRVRSGVVIRSWEVAGNGLTDLGIQLSEVTTNIRQEQKVVMQLGPETELKALMSLEDGIDPAEDEDAEERPVAAVVPDDIAVALWYRSANPGAAELRTPYVYLTDQGIQSIKSFPIFRTIEIVPNSGYFAKLGL